MFKDVAVKILMEQEFHVERFKEFLREVRSSKICGRIQIQTHNKLQFEHICLYFGYSFTSFFIFFLLLLGYNNERPAASKYCAVYGCSYKAPKLVHSHGIFIKVL